MASMMDRIKSWFGSSAETVKDDMGEANPDAMPPPGERGDSERETSTNAQTEGAVGEPWSGDE
jgi:hypothetical protein